VSVIRKTDQSRGLREARAAHRCDRLAESRKRFLSLVQETLRGNRIILGDEQSAFDQVRLR